MLCPVCRNHHQQQTNLRSAGFSEQLVECQVCGTQWFIQHGLAEVVRDVQADSFLDSTAECVEGLDYCWAV